MGELRVLDLTGDTKYTWETAAEASVCSVVFDKMLGKGYMAARINPDGSSGEKVTAFDAGAGSLLMIPPVIGG